MIVTDVITEAPCPAAVVPGNVPQVGCGGKGGMPVAGGSVYGKLLWSLPLLEYLLSCVRASTFGMVEILPLPCPNLEQLAA